MRFCYSIIIAVLTLFFASCSRPERQAGEALSVYSEDSAMAHYLTDPDRSVMLLDSAVLVGNLSRQRADYLRAMVLFNGYNDPASSLRLCQQLIDYEAWKQLPDSEDVTSFKVDLCRLMATVATTTDNYVLVLRYARWGAELAHGHRKLLGDEADCMSRMGYVLCLTGQTEQGLAALRQAEQLVENDDTWSSLLTYLNNAKKIYAAYNSTGRHDEAKRAVLTALDRLERLPAEIKQVRHAPESMYADSQALTEFIEYYQVPYYCYLANIYADTNQHDLADQVLQKIAQLPHSDNPSTTSSLIHPLIVLGRYDEARRQIDRQRQYLRSDTISDSYVALLNEQMLLSTLTGGTQEALSLAQDIIAIDDSIHSNALQLMLADAATQYQLQDECLRRIDAEKTLQQTVSIFVIVIIALIALMAFVIIYHLRSKNRQLGQKYAQVQHELDEIIQDNNNLQGIDQSPEAIYSRAVSMMEERLAFQDVDIDIASFSKLLMTNRTYVSAAINRMAGMNFRAWVARYRIEHAKKLLLEDPTITYDSLAQECGFDNRTSLYRWFKGIERMTPTEWLQMHNDNPTSK